MCKKKQFKYCPSEIDPCMKNIINFLWEIDVETLACCCGHGKYPMTLVVKTIDEDVIEIFSDIEIPRKKKFYKKDKQGYYYIPETINAL